MSGGGGALGLFRVGFLLPPPIQRQDDKAHDGSALPPFVAHLFQVAQFAIGTFDMIVGADALSRRAVQVGDHLVELLRGEHGHSAGQVGVG